MPQETSDPGQGHTNHSEPAVDTSTSDDHSPEGHPISPSAGQLRCSICQGTFRRPEHLKRHYRSHTKEKPFECLKCGRCFSRTDTLHRHEISHHAPGIEGGLGRAHRITVKTFRACFKCAVARVRCSGGTPCARCQNRTLGCQYPTERRSKSKASKDSPQISSYSALNGQLRRNAPRVSQSPRLDAEDAHRTRARMGSRPQSSGHRINQFQFHFVDFEPDRASTSPVHAQQQEIPEQEPTSGQTQILEDSSDPNQPVLLSGDKAPGNISRTPYSSYPDVNSQQIYQNIPSSGIPSAFPVEPTPGLGQQVANVPAAVANSHMDIEMANASNQPIQMEFDQNLFDQSVLSTINWLPTDFLPDTSDSLSMISGFPSQPTPGIWPGDPNLRTAWLPPATNIHQTGPYTRDVTPTPSGNIPIQTRVQSPGQYTHAFGEGSSHSGSCEGTVRSGDYYVDGEGARFPKYRRKRGAWPKTSGDRLVLLSRLKENERNSFSFPRINDVPMDNLPEEKQFTRRIDSSTYDKICQLFNQLCLTKSFLFTPFESDYFPAVDILSRFIQLYFDSFQPVYPILHPQTFDPNRCHLLLTLAVSAIGCQIADMPEADKCGRALHEFLRRAIYAEKERSLSDSTPIWLIQAMLLNCIGLLHSGSERAKQSALTCFGDLINTANHGELLSLNGSQSKWIDPSRGSVWELWIEDEIRRRTGYCIWLVDCTLAYHFDIRPRLSIEDCQAPLPSHEILWQAEAEDSWRQLYRRSTENASLYSAVQSLYIAKKLVSGIGEFGHVLLVHALYHRMWEVGDYFRRPLSCWTPTAKKQSRDSAIPSGPIWLPGVPVYSKWRNNACDCLDILHWTANGTIAKAAGLEHPTVLHLHAARIVLLVPFREIRCLAVSLANETIRWSEHQKAVEEHHIRRWVKYDQYKAHLAIIHAGSVLWYVRRYSTNAFHEPVAVFLAILTLWAYGWCHGSIIQQVDPKKGSQPDSSEFHPEPTFFHLDRPCDDELVQLFVRKGQTMRGNVTGVGDICGPYGPERILKEGCRILLSLMSWGISGDFIAILTKLADQVSHRSPSSDQSREVEAMIS